MSHKKKRVHHPIHIYYKVIKKSTNSRYIHFNLTLPFELRKQHSFIFFLIFFLYFF